MSQLDQKIDQIRQRIFHVPERREELQNSLAEKEGGFAGKKEALAAAEKQKHNLETELQISNARLTELQLRVNQIKTNKEYQAALKEIAESKKVIGEMEDKLLAVMSEVETVTKELQEGEQAYQSLRGSSAEELRKLEEEEKRIEEEVKEFETKKIQMRSSLETKLLGQYDRLKSYRADVVTAVVNGTCQGCHMRVPPQLYIEIQKYRVVHSCPSCQRILYLEGGL